MFKKFCALQAHPAVYNAFKKLLVPMFLSLRAAQGYQDATQAQCIKLQRTDQTEPILPQQVRSAKSKARVAIFICINYLPTNATSHVCLFKDANIQIG